MVDQTSQFYAILTNVGAAKQANADALGIPWVISQMAIGDANGTDPQPSATQTALINEWRRAPLNQLKVDEKDSSVIVAEQIIPADVGGRWIREIALYDSDGAMVAVANCPPTYKPLLSQGSGRTQIVRLNLVVSNASSVQLKIDPSVVLATREYVDSRITEEINKLDHKQSVRVATTAAVVLSGLQSIDGVAVVAGDRVLVKNQAAQKDNGLYVAGSNAWVRAADADVSAEVTSGLIVAVEQGATLADTRWQLVTDGAITLGTTALVFQNITQGFAPIVAPALVSPTANTLPQFDASKGLATTEFVQRALGNFSKQTSLVSPATVTKEMAGSRIVVTGSGTVTLPALKASLAGSRFYIFNAGANSLTIATQGSERITAFLTQNIASFTLGIGSLAVVTCGESFYVLEEGTVALKYAPEFGASLSGAACYQKLPSGDIEQWGVYTGIPAGSSVTITLPVAMLGVPTCIQLTYANFASDDPVGAAPVFQARASTNGSFTVRNLYNLSSAFSWTVKGRV